MILDISDRCKHGRHDLCNGGEQGEEGVDGGGFSCTCDCHGRRKMSIELSKCPSCENEAYSVPQSEYGGLRGICKKCDFRGPVRDTPDKAALAWNEMCECIRVGKDIMGGFPDGYHMVGHPYRKAWRDCRDDGYLLFRVDIERFPAPVLDPLDPLDPLDVLRNWKEWITVAESTIRQEQLLRDTDIILAQAPDAAEGRAE